VRRTWFLKASQLVLEMSLLKCLATRLSPFWLMIKIADAMVVEVLNK
jgi:hypothetical protein